MALRALSLYRRELRRYSCPRHLNNGSLLSCSLCGCGQIAKGVIISVKPSHFGNLLLGDDLPLSPCFGESPNELPRVSRFATPLYILAPPVKTCPLDQGGGMT